MGEHEVEHRVAVPAVPDGEPVEPDETLEERQPREQEHLDQRQVAGEQSAAKRPRPISAASKLCQW